MNDDHSRKFQALLLLSHTTVFELATRTGIDARRLSHFTEGRRYALRAHEYSLCLATLRKLIRQRSDEVEQLLGIVAPEVGASTVAVLEQRPAGLQMPRSVRKHFAL